MIWYPSRSLGDFLAYFAHLLRGHQGRPAASGTVLQPFEPFVPEAFPPLGAPRLGLVDLFCGRGCGHAALDVPDQPQPVAFVGVLGFPDAFQNCRVHWCVCDIGIYKHFGPYAGRTPSEAALGHACGGGVRPAGCGCPTAAGVSKYTIKIVLNHNQLTHSGILYTVYEIGKTNYAPTRGLSEIV